MKKTDFDNFDYDYEDIDSELADMVKSLRFRNDPKYRRFRFANDDYQAKRKRNHRQPRQNESEFY